MKNILYLIRLSRPRFWAYTAGPFAVGFIAGIPRITDTETPLFYMFLFYFLLPANIFLYGINDYFDYETDKHNVKKQTHEILLKKEYKKILKYILSIIFLSSVSVIFLPIPIFSKFLFLCFIFLSAAYSMPPFRFKKLPIADSVSNILYILPGVFAYSLFGKFPSNTLLLAIVLWPISMHLYSAIPDILPDKKAHLKTTAVLLGEKYSLLACSILWALCVGVAFFTPLSYLAVIGFVYPLIPLIGLFKRSYIEKLYWIFPFINVGIGFLIFLFLLSQKI